MAKLTRIIYDNSNLEYDEEVPFPTPKQEKPQLSENNKGAKNTSITANGITESQN